MSRIRYLLDADVISEMMRPAPDPNVADVPDTIADEGLGLASITVWEILNGIGLLGHGRRRQEIEGRFHALLADCFAGSVVDWTLNDAAACARIMESKRRRGEPLDDHLPDAMLAGLASRRGLAVTTRNVSEFRNTGIEILDPWSPGASSGRR